MTRWFSIKPGITLKGRKFKGLRGWAGKPFHPPLTDIPVAAYVVAPIFDVLAYVFTRYPSFYETDPGTAQGLFDAATYTFVAGYVVAIPTIITGFWDWWKGLERDHSTGWLGKAKRTQAWRTANWHAVMMLAANVLVLVAIVIRWKGDATVPSLGLLILSLLIALIVFVGATYGGSLVYDYAFNVEQDIDYAWEERETDVLPGKEKPVADTTP
ncbi:MAG TPA: DUF2231 domain-containing protein [Actinomycetota bacterium]|nr:DUF2231 domain-containing protein [Actinomycetota bacterium]